MFSETTLSSPSVPCFFIGEYTKEGLPRPLAPSLSLLFMCRRDYGDRILIAPTTGLNKYTAYISMISRARYFDFVAEFGKDPIALKH